MSPSERFDEIIEHLENACLDGGDAGWRRHCEWIKKLRSLWIAEQMRARREKVTTTTTTESEYRS